MESPYLVLLVGFFGVLLLVAIRILCLYLSHSNAAKYIATPNAAKLNNNNENFSIENLNKVTSENTHKNNTTNAELTELNKLRDKWKSLQKKP